MKYSKSIPVLLLGCLSAAALFAQVRPPQYPPPDIIPPEVLQTRDALQADPQHYRLEFENDKMRVLRLTLKPSETVPMHDDKDALVVGLNECHVRFTSPNGRSEDIHLEAGAARWTFGDTRSEKNLGTKPVEMLFIETKSPSIVQKVALAAIFQRLASAMRHLKPLALFSSYSLWAFYSGWNHEEGAPVRDAVCVGHDRRPVHALRDLRRLASSEITIANRRGHHVC